jgi:hypothetical protein
MEKQHVSICLIIIDCALQNIIRNSVFGKELARTQAEIQESGFRKFRALKYLRETHFGFQIAGDKTKKVLNDKCHFKFILWPGST